MEEVEKSDRRVKPVTCISDRKGHRDHGKMFLIKEKSAAAAEAWALRVYLAFARSGVEFPAEVKSLGLLGLALLGLNASRFLAYDEAKVILDELMSCVRIISDPKGNPEFVRDLVESDISEVGTRLWLKQEVLELHLGFSLADADQLGGTLVAAAEALNSLSTPTSPLQ